MTDYITMNTHNLVPISRNNIRSFFESKQPLRISDKMQSELWCVESRSYFNQDEGVKWRNIYDPGKTFDRLPLPTFTWNEIRDSFYISEYDTRCPDHFAIDSHIEDLRVPCVGQHGFMLDQNCCFELAISDNVVQSICNR